MEIPEEEDKPFDYDQWVEEENQRVEEEKRKSLAKKEKMEAEKVESQWEKREAIDEKPEPNVFYRKMSEGEYNAATKTKGKAYDFKAVFGYTNKSLYRLWMTTSLSKCQQFGNANASDEGNIIVKFIFSKDFAKNAMPHQMSGIQRTKDVVAMHREGFAQRGNMNKKEDVREVLAQGKAFNLGFTSSHLQDLQNALISAEKIQ